MPIDFHDEKHRRSYATRTADDSWKHMMRQIIDPRGLRVADIGCGGGIYSRAWVDLGADQVIGVDSSKVMVDAAREQSARMSNVYFVVGDAVKTGLNGASVDLVFERALIHHLKDLVPAMTEAYRVLAPSGRVIIQDRTPADVALPGSEEHIRGYIFERFPRLLAIEQGRRWPGEEVRKAMEAAGFQNIAEYTFWETRRVYPDISELAEDLRNRTGRSILHDLSDAELDDLIRYIGSKVPHDKEIVERDRWTLWIGER
ncbi:MAG: class I SAM-dependent methyltransferase [Alicyclobacillus macrosporangiidus]|nr:class I SAM-dependent methyltransferase [Alicyclobacillus macrosporangiidus]